MRDVIRERNEKLRQKAETVIDVPPETQPSTNPKLESALIALDDATDERSLAEIVEHCIVFSAELSEDEKIQLREKIKASKKRLMPTKKDSEVWMAGKTGERHRRCLAIPRRRNRPRIFRG